MNALNQAVVPVSADKIIVCNISEHIREVVQIRDQQERRGQKHQLSSRTLLDIRLILFITFRIQLSPKKAVWQHLPALQWNSIRIFF